MDEIIHVKNISYARYEELLMRRDNLEKEAYELEREYVRVFGEKILNIFTIKVECIRKKKLISYCQAVLNRGNIVNQEELQKYLMQEMSAYEAQLDQIIKDNAAARAATEISEYELLEIKKIYKRLVKKLHPDINPETNKKGKLRELWERIIIAYRCNKLKELKELEIQANAALEVLCKGGIDVDIPDIDEKIKELEAEIDNIRNTDPYMYKYILEDEAAVIQKNEALDEEYASYEDYEKQLDAMIEELMEKGVRFTWRMN